MAQQRGLAHSGERKKKQREKRGGRLGLGILVQSFEKGKEMNFLFREVQKIDKGSNKDQTNFQKIQENKNQCI